VACCLLPAEGLQYHPSPAARCKQRNGSFLFSPPIFAENSNLDGGKIVDRPALSRMFSWLAGWRVPECASTSCPPPTTPTNTHCFTTSKLMPTSCAGQLISYSLRKHSTLADTLGYLYYSNTRPTLVHLSADQLSVPRGPMP
jgi:hypothetical protein